MASVFINNKENRCCNHRGGWLGTGIWAPMFCIEFHGKRPKQKSDQNRKGTNTGEGAKTKKATNTGEATTIG